MMRIKPKQRDKPIAIRKKMLPILNPKITPEISSCVSIMDPCLPYRSYLVLSALPGKHLFKPRFQRSPNALFPGQHNEDQQEADEQLPVSDESADQVFHAGVSD